MNKTIILFCTVLLYTYNISLEAMIGLKRAGQRFQQRSTDQARRYFSSLKNQPTSSELLQDSWKNRFKSWISPTFRRQRERALADERLRIADEMIAREEESLKQFWRTRSGAENAQLTEVLLRRPETVIPKTETPAVKQSSKWNNFKSWITGQSKREE